MAEQVPVNFEFRANQSFADFFPGENKDILEHLQQSVRGEGESQIFIWGAKGLGKSHLLQACCHYAYQLQRRAFYFAFTERDLPDPALLTDLEKFDTVCLDNIEFIAGDHVWELALFNFFNQHRGLGHQLIFSSTQAPQQLAIQLSDLRTRINWGLALKIKPLSDADCIAALIFKANQMGFDISPQAGRFLFTHYARDLPTLWELLAQLDRASLAAKRKLTLPFLKQFLTPLTHD